MTTDFHFGAGLTDFTILRWLSHYYEGEACTSKNLLDLQQSFQPKLTVQVKLYASVSQPGCLYFFQRVLCNSGVHGGVRAMASVYNSAQYENMF